MRWVEVIGVRATASNREILEARLMEMIADLQSRDPAQSIILLRRLPIGSDLCLHLVHDSKAADTKGSTLGLLLAAEMKAFGLVHHSIWSETAGIGTCEERPLK